MNTTKTLVLQTAVYPFYTAIINDKDNIDITFINRDFKVKVREFFAKKLDLDKNSSINILFNKGPGSYTGIRQSLAFVLGSSFGSNLSNRNVTYFAFDTFDYVSSIAQFKDKKESKYINKKAIVAIQAWPRLDFNKQIKIPNIDLDTVKFYIRHKKQVGYSDINSIMEAKTVVCYASDMIIDKMLPSINKKVNESVMISTSWVLSNIESIIYNTYVTLTLDKPGFSTKELLSVRPFYVNPVKIVSAKK